MFMLSTLPTRSIIFHFVKNSSLDLWIADKILKPNMDLQTNSTEFFFLHQFSENHESANSRKKCLTKGRNSWQLSSESEVSISRFNVTMYLKDGIFHIATIRELHIPHTLQLPFSGRLIQIKVRVGYVQRINFNHMIVPISHFFFHRVDVFHS